MGLDIKTLFIADVAVLLATAAASLYYWHRDRDGDWLLWWTAGTATTGLSMLIIGLFGPVPSPVVGVPAATSSLAGIVLVWQSMRRLNGRPATIGLAIVLVALFALVLTAALILGTDVHERAGLLMAAMALSAIACAWELSLGEPAPAQRRFLLAAAFCVMAALLGVTAVLTGLQAHARVASFGDLLGDALPLVNSLAILCVCFYVLLIVNDRASGRYRRLASTDDLTGLPNRRHFIEEAGRLSERVDAGGSPACLLMMDLDHFSAINRRFGHAGGDQALIAFAQVLRQGLRAGDIVARYGGEEFCAFLPAIEVAQAVEIAERLREAIAGLPIAVAGQTAALTVSIGVAPLRNGDLVASIGDADAALYQAKGRGRNQVAAAQGDDPRSANDRKTRIRIVR
jgi:diguanylate cyclase (GGDEF)-like protein